LHELCYIHAVCRSLIMKSSTGSISGVHTTKTIERKVGCFMTHE